MDLRKPTLGLGLENEPWEPNSVFWEAQLCGQYEHSCRIAQPFATQQNAREYEEQGTQGVTQVNIRNTSEHKGTQSKQGRADQTQHGEHKAKERTQGNIREHKERKGGNTKKQPHTKQNKATQRPTDARNMLQTSFQKHPKMLPTPSKQGTNIEPKCFQNGP